MTTYHFIVKGRVQGVGFRYFTYANAKKLKINGWVRNLDSGDVEVEAQGSYESIERFRTSLKKGPMFSKVSALEESTLQREEFKSFEVLN